MPSAAVGERVRALLIEDNPGDADLVREYLASVRQPAIEILHVERLRDALGRLTIGDVDVILLDLSLPDASGLGGLRSIRAAAPDVPVVVLSGSDESVALEALDEGAQDYLRKGDVDGELLGRSLRYAILRQEVRDRERLLAHEHAARVTAEEAVAARDEFLATAAHELRTPLTPLMLRIAHLERSARARAAAEHPDCATCAEKLESSVGQVERLKRLVNSLLDVARITSGHLVLNRQEVDLAAVAHRAAREFKLEAAAAGSSLSVDAPAPVLGAWDPSSVEQIVANLLSNAVKYGAGEPVELAVRRVDGHAALTVKDRGIGIAPEDVARIFQRFERAVSVRHYGGLGLGLFIVRHLAEAHDGSVAVESRPGGGSTFTVVLPVARNQALA